MGEYTLFNDLLRFYGYSVIKMPQGFVAAAIDGPVGAGKSTIAKEVAKRLGFIYADTGALYRAVGLFCIDDGADLKQPEEIAKRIDRIKLEIALVDGTQHIFLNGVDVSEKIRMPEVSMAASAVSAVPEVRDALLDMQRDIAQKNNVIMDGRDIGTVVLPNARVKIFLTAKPEVRARRRFKELIAKGKDISYEEVFKDLEKRDFDDTHRKAAPLRKAEDAVTADTTELDFEQSVELVCRIIKERL